ncbi:leucine-rich_repeat domain-containing protein [Hexamita inflata]|uniref:Leucine-rich repeat domain-containing protein n=1 Tax=Hexamita inflata TaxID=28002 RepID=A0AA86UJC4_9EUKA|nr:leucine-rich repeat domain-containing protein [Hexamita inflata]
MQPNHVIIRKENLSNHFDSSQKLEIYDIKQMEDVLEMDVPAEVWEDAQNRDLLFLSSQLIKETKQFTFKNMQIQHIYLISLLTNLTELNLYNNNISDISSISKLKNLQILDLSVNYIEGISVLQSLTDLTHLYISGNQLISYTLALPSLVELFLCFNKLQDKSGFQNSPKLEKLALFETGITDLRTNIPHQLFGLKELYLSRNNFMDIQYLSNFVDLQYLHLNENQQLQNIGPLKFCTQLTRLDISETSVADIWPLQFMINLNTLNMAKTKVDDLHPLQHLYKLENISAYRACIIDVSPLSDFTQLQQLTFWQNKIYNEDTLKHHPNFSEYDFSDQKFPTIDELKFYNIILSVHNSHKQIRKIQVEKRVSKFQESMTHQKESINLKINEQIQVMNKKIEIIFSQKYYTDQQ